MGGKEVATALRKIFREDARHPRNLQTDKGKEFYNADVRKILDEREVKHYSTYSVMKASVVDRLAAAPLVELQSSQTQNDPNASGGRDAHRRRKTAAHGVRSREYSRAGEISSRRSGAREQIQNDLRKRLHSQFDHRDIAKVQRTNPVTYLLKDVREEAIAGGFYEHELLRVSNPDVYLVEKVLRKRGNRAFVKWLGMDSSHNSWIDKASVL
ncbi:uncharacterized protein LOC112461386 [Temnothorax curvispinosus]|uniref:Uncharacterized protein LOC112461386 n=1 Tax=Temnothorax curvispinosus TaxID=300111 RepID=A0A6J1QPC0_9HYME|nr:uncharacterized protein LOC112461386 [Temnothorax curvispinosus]